MAGVQRELITGNGCLNSSSEKGEGLTADLKHEAGLGRVSCELVIRLTLKCETQCGR